MFTVPPLPFRPRAARRLTIPVAAGSLVAIAMLGCQPIDAVTDIVDGEGGAASAAAATPPRKMDAQTLQAAAIGLGDEIIELVTAATDRLEDVAPEVADRRHAHEIKLAVARGVVNTVAGPNSLGSLLDLVTMTTLMEDAARESELPRFGESASILISALGRARAEAWRVLAIHVAPEQIEQLREAIDAWPMRDTSLLYVSQVRLRELAALRSRTAEDDATNGPGGRRRVTLLSLLSLDPLANLDPTTRELQRSRLLGERAFYQAQRTSQLLRWEIEGLLYDVLSTPEGTRLLADASVAVSAADRTAATLDALPTILESERSAAIANLEAAVSRQREASIEQLQIAVAAERTALLDEVRALPETIDAATSSLTPAMEQMAETAVALESAVTAFDELMVRFGVDPERVPEPRDPDAESFDVAEYGDAATRIAAAARDLTETLGTIERILDQPALGGPDGAPPPAVVAFQDAGNRLLDRAFRRGVFLILIAGATLAVAIVIGRRLGGGRRA